MAFQSFSWTTNSGWWHFPAPARPRRRPDVVISV